MTKGDLVGAISKEAGITKVAAEKAVSLYRSCNKVTKKRRCSKSRWVRDIFYLKKKGKKGTEPPEWKRD